jgi:hypothetical protein
MTASEILGLGFLIMFAVPGAILIYYAIKEGDL